MKRTLQIILSLLVALPMLAQTHDNRLYLTVGEITDFLNITLDAEEYLTNVEFGVFAHTAEVRRGSSGGALVNSALQLVGINYAGKSGDEFSNGYAIPINKIHEFIEKYM